MTSPTDGSSREVLLAEFRAEAKTQLDDLDRQLVRLEEAGSIPDEDREGLLRSLHTLKGNAAMVGYRAIADQVHRVENLLKGPEAAAVRNLDPIFELSAALRDALEKLGGPDEAEALAAVAAVDLGRATAGDGDGVGRRGESRREPERAAGAETRPAGEAASDRRAEHGAEAGPEPGDAAPDRPGAPADARKAPVDVVRVPFDKLDRLLTDVGELLTAHARLDRFIDANRDDLIEAGVHRGLTERVDELERRSAALRDATMDLRLVPLRTLFGHYPAVVRDLARERGKRARLEVEGASVEVDKAAVDALGEPLMHLVRNAVDHGLEPPNEREAKGKDPVGTISLTATRTGDHIRIEVADDGAGLDRAQILRRARERGLVEADTELDDDAVRDLIFSPGFSTRAEATTISGRGVGLDIVRRSVARMRGSLEVHDRPGSGTAFEIRVPLTLAIVPVLVFESEGEVLALAASDVGGTRSHVRIDRAGAREIVRIGDTVVPVARPHRVFGWQSGRGAEETAIPYAIVVRRGGRAAAVPADRLIDQREVVVRPMPPHLGPVPGVSAATVAPDGHVVLLVDADAFIDIHTQSRGTRT